ncbi:MAG: phospholipid carrier-dependent glycosyltransferase [Defluviitaleaceae bacterium]|nr:phospholipid carrier-dependent glycosyltransferase [Defluviitaleaceae bacterium]
MNKLYIWLIVILAVIVRLVLAGFDGLSHPTDMQAFRAWGHMLVDGGFSAFYGDPRFTDYPPGYMYVLAGVEWLRHAINFALQFFNLGSLDFGSLGHNMLIKLPAIIADAFTVVFIYKIAARFCEGDKKYIVACIAALLYAFNPAIIMNSAVWGQVDSIHTLTIAVSLYLISINKMFASVLIFAASIMIKPQSLMFSPIYLFMFYKYVFGDGQPKFNAKQFGKLALYGLACFTLMAAIVAPFIDWANLPPNLLDIPVFEQYIRTFTTYPFVTHNAYNIYAMLGLNTVSLNEVAFLGITYGALGTGFLVVITLFSFVLLWRKHDAGSIFFVAALLVLCTFMLSVRMHERYGFPALAMLLLAYVTTRDKRMLWIYIGFSAVFFLNYFDVLAMSLAGFNWAQIAHTARIFAIPAVVLFVYTIYFALRHFFPAMPTLSPARLNFKRKDVVICGTITVFYAIFAFTNLGNMSSPTLYFRGESGHAIVADFGQVHHVQRVQYMLGPRDNQSFSLEFSEDGQVWHSRTPISARNVFAWGYYDFDSQPRARFVRITPTTRNLYMMEMGFRDHNLDLIPDIFVTTRTGWQLFSEQRTVPLQTRDYMHSTFFDEIYHPRTAYEFLHQMDVFEWSHPPLGKVIISAGVNVFGMTPFGWRFMGALTGVLMLPLLYALAKALFNDRFWAAFATFIFAFDFMHYTQTRLATIDSYVVFFIMGMYYFMYKYTQTNFFRDDMAKTLQPLLFSGIFMGLAIASKWQGAYAAIGLAVIFFWTLWQRHREHKVLIAQRSTSNKSESHERFWSYAAITCLACVGFFVVVPAIIYIASYIPYWNTGSLYPDRGFLAAVWQNQVDMFNYHSGLVAQHPYTSSWWQWIINYRPIFLFSNDLGGNMAQGISSFGNPLVWWGGIAAFVYCAYAAFARRSKVAIFLMIAYLSQILPWIFVPRISFIYHYFPNVPFLTLMIAYALKESGVFTKDFWANIGITPKTAAVAFAVAVFALFVLFYPVLTGTPINREFVNMYLRWFSSWVLLI